MNTQTLADSTTMQAAVYHRFGPPERVRVEQLARPVPKPSEVLIKIVASTVSIADHRVRSRDIPPGLGVLSALTIGVFRPRKRVLGMDLAGVVEAVGANVSTFAAGDEVIALAGARFGGHAEYLCLPEGAAIARKPQNMTFEEAVTLVFGGSTALVFFNLVALKPGDAVLVNGASGAVGTAAVQLAKHAGARVTAVCSGANRELVTALGADRVIDYTTDDFATDGTRYDVIVDCVGNAPFERVEASIRQGGALLLVITDLRGMLRARAQSRRSGKVVSASAAAPTAADLGYLVGLAESGDYRMVRDRTYDLADIVEAHRYVDTGRKRGNVVLRVAPASTQPSE